ncbi:MAG: serine/threonine-protein kinase [Planctomycetota bacterium]
MTEHETRTIGKYTLLERIGAGAMGTVYRARDTEGREVAVKVLNEEPAASEEFIRRFLREIVTLAGLNHPNLVRYIDADTDGQSLFYAMEFVAGRSLGDLVAAGAVFREEQVVDIAGQLAAVLGYAEREKVVHRDVKPDNIIIEDATGSVKLLDLGLARETHTALKKVTRGIKAIGTADYMSPEQARGEDDIDIRADIYGMGATLYHLVAGAPPHEGRTEVEVMLKIVSEEVPPLHERAPGVSRNLACIIGKMLRLKRDRRYQRPADVQRDLTLLKERRFVPPEDAVRERRQVQRGRRRRTTVIITLLVWTIIVLLGLVALVLFWKWR